MEGHEERAQELEYELADMEKQQDDLDDGIHAARDDWDAKKRDGSVPGARGEAGDEPEEPEAKGEGEPEVEDEKS